MLAQHLVIQQRFFILQVVIPIAFQTLALSLELLIRDFLFSAFRQDVRRTRPFREFHFGTINDLIRQQPFVSAAQQGFGRTTVFVQFPL